MTVTKRKDDSDTLVKKFKKYKEEKEKFKKYIEEKSKEEKVEEEILKTANTQLFQIPFKKKQIKTEFPRITHSVFNALTMMGLRQYSSSRKDSKTIKSIDSDGVYSKDIAEYFSTIFDTQVNCQMTYDEKFLYLDLKDGYATLVSVGYKDDIGGISRYVIIIYKHKGVIYYYKPTGKINTTNINKILESDDITHFENYECFYTDSKGHQLNKKKLGAPIMY